MLNKAIDENFMRRYHARMWQVAYTPQEAIEAIVTTPAWDPSIRKIAAI